MQFAAVPKIEGQNCGGCGELCNKTCVFLYGNRYMLLVQTVGSLIGAEFCAWMARDLKPRKNTLVEFYVALGCSIFASVTYLAIVGYIFFRKKDPVRAWLKKLRKDQKKYWCWYQILRAMGVVGLLILFAYISDVLAERKKLNLYSVMFFFGGHLHVVSLTKLFTMKDLVCLSDSLLAIGVTLSFKLDHEKKYVRSALIYTFAVAIVYFRFSHIRYGHEKKENVNESRTDVIEV